MLILITGVPGAGKTANTLAFVDADVRFKNRPVYQYGVTQCSMPGWNELGEEEVRRWYELPEGSVIVIDECYSIFPVRKVGDKVPQHVDEVARHRHGGFDIVLICQHPHQIDTFVRKMTGLHYHFDRPFGLPRSRRHEWQKCVADPDDHFAKKEAIVKSFPLPKKYFGFYKSAELHTHKIKIPAKIYGLVAAVVVVAFLGFKFYQSRIAPAKTDVAGSSAGSIFPVESSGKVHVLSREEYLESYRPRVDGLAYTAPIYDKAFQVKTFPKPNCVASSSKTSLHAGCKCYSQQGTRLAVPDNVCRDLVANGWFDPTKDEKDNNERGRVVQRESRRAETGGFYSVGPAESTGTALAPLEVNQSRVSL